MRKRRQQQQCKGKNARGEPCKNFIVGPDGFCHAHSPGGVERMRLLGSRGGKATLARLRSAGLKPEDLSELETLEDAQRALDQVRRAVLTNKISHNQGTAASKAISEWVRTEGTLQTRHIVTELHGELEARKREVEELKAQLAARGLRRVQ